MLKNPHPFLNISTSPIPFDRASLRSNFRSCLKPVCYRHLGNEWSLQTRSCLMLPSSLTYHRENVLAMYSISFRRSSVRIVGTIFVIRNTHLHLHTLKKNLVILLYGCENWTLLLKKEHRPFFGIGCCRGGGHI